MRIELIYGIPLFESKALFKNENYESSNCAGFLEDLTQDIDSIELAGVEKAEMFIHNFGGGNNDGAIYLGISLHTIIDDYAAISIPLSLLNAGSENWQQQINTFDVWMKTDAGKYFKNLTRKTPEILVVCDSD